MCAINCVLLSAVVLPWISLSEQLRFYTEVLPEFFFRAYHGLKIPIKYSCQSFDSRSIQSSFSWSIRNYFVRCCEAFIQCHIWSNICFVIVLDEQIDSFRVAIVCTHGTHPFDADHTGILLRTPYGTPSSTCDTLS